jgi:hypothetical protein
MKQGGLWVCVSKTVCGFLGMHVYQKKKTDYDAEDPTWNTERAHVKATPCLQNHRTDTHLRPQRRQLRSAQPAAGNQNSLCAGTDVVKNLHHFLYLQLLTTDITRVWGRANVHKRVCVNMHDGNHRAVAASKYECACGSACSCVLLCNLAKMYVCGHCVATQTHTPPTHAGHNDVHHDSQKERKSPTPATCAKSAVTPHCTPGLDRGRPQGRRRPQRAPWRPARCAAAFHTCASEHRRLPVASPSQP